MSERILIAGWAGLEISKNSKEEDGRPQYSQSPTNEVHEIDHLQGVGILCRNGEMEGQVSHSISHDRKVEHARTDVTGRTEYETRLPRTVFACDEVIAMIDARSIQDADDDWIFRACDKVLRDIFRHET